MTAPANTPSVWTFAGNAKDIQRLLTGSAQDLPRAALLCLNRREAATLLGTAALDSLEAVAQAAARLRAAVCEAVVITGDEADYADTPQASGWLSPSATPGQTQSHPDTGAVFADAAAQALARGFVAMEAIVMAWMARSDAVSQHGGGPLQARPDFAQRIANLPHFSLPQATDVSGFASLLDADLGLYAVVDSADWVARVVTAGVRTVQLRIKNAEGEHQRAMVREQIRESVRVAATAGAQLFINDHWQLAIEEGAYGVHLGQDDLHVADLAAIARAGLRLGISTHAYWEVCRAWALRPSYIACGPIHPTQAKAMPWIPQGNNNLAYWCTLLPLPVVGIAGMDAVRSEQAAQAGAAGVAVISAITAAVSPEAAIVQLQQAVQRGRSQPHLTAPLLPQPTLLPT
ncbi:MAG: thiamine phosphate synthase [Polaromonas sp.]|uniref:thiamine phosphate synthase n=1 Tax=Polaromonas sp. TaxID=1869339 RepID=UPI00248722ED|nr:thiamine phosphate synthase [Polaromonas sp.]MDI1237160.1 thiamine phosphate synthase [Polaromonas sp.]